MRVISLSSVAEKLRDARATEQCRHAKKLQSCPTVTIQYIVIIYLRRTFLSFSLLTLNDLNDFEQSFEVL